MVAAQFDLEIEQGTTFAFECQWVQKGTPDTPYDITGCTIRMQIRKGQKEPVILEATSANGKAFIVDASLGKFGVKFTPADTNTISVNLAKYDLEIEFPSTDVYRVLQGNVITSPNITQADTDATVL